MSKTPIRAASVSMDVAGKAGDFLWKNVKIVVPQSFDMTDVVYAVRISNLEYSGLKIMDVKIGKSTNIDNTLSQYSRGARNIELLDMWKPNPQKNLSTAEKGVHEIAEKYAYDKQSEKFVFLQGGYQQFAETVNKVLLNTTRTEFETEEETGSDTTETQDYTGTTPAIIKILGETKEVRNWTEALQTGIAHILSDVEDPEKVTEIEGRTRDYFVKEGRQSDLVAPKPIPDTELYVESNFSANDVNRVLQKVLNKYDYQSDAVEIFTEEDN
jgi:hypothetical protein